MIGDRLEKLIWRLIDESVRSQLGKPTREVAPDRGIRESLTLDDETGHWAFVWHEANTNDTGSNPDFTIIHGHRILLAIEAKNHDPRKHHPNLEWTLSRVIRRFRIQDAETKILYIPLLNPTPKDQKSVVSTLKEHEILTIQFGRQIAERHSHAYEYVQRDLGPHIEAAIQSGKTRHLSLALNYQL
jgi:hypothetical protein